MAKDKPTWRDRYPDEVTCVRCLEVQDQMYLDRMLWCEDCRARARNRASWWGWLGGLIFGGVIALYIWIAIQPTVLLGAWFGTVMMAIWLGSKASRELVYGIIRFTNNRAVEAVPPHLEDLENAEE